MSQESTQEGTQEGPRRGLAEVPREVLALCGQRVTGPCGQVRQGGPRRGPGTRTQPGTHHHLPWYPYPLTTPGYPTPTTPGTHRTCCTGQYRTVQNSH